MPLLDLCLLGLFFGLAFVRFVQAPGTTIDLPRTEEARAGALATSAVLTVQSSGVLLFDGQLWDADSISRGLSDWVNVRSEEEPVLLVLADAETPLAAILALSDAARVAGFAAVHLATEEATDADAFLLGLEEGANPPRQP